MDQRSEVGSYKTISQFNMIVNRNPEEEKMTARLWRERRSTESERRS